METTCSINISRQGPRLLKPFSPSKKRWKPCEGMTGAVWDSWMYFLLISTSTGFCQESSLAVGYSYLVFGFCIFLKVIVPCLASMKQRELIKVCLGLTCNSSPVITLGSKYCSQYVTIGALICLRTKCHQDPLFTLWSLWQPLSNVHCIPKACSLGSKPLWAHGDILLTD